MGYLQRARNFCKAALEEFNLAKQDHNELKIRQAAEKGWLAVVQAANALLDKYNIKIPKGTRKREDLLFELQKVHKKLHHQKLAEQYGYFLRSLHIDCFYDGEISIKRVERDLRKIEEYIETIAKL